MKRKFLTHTLNRRQGNTMAEKDAAEVKSPKVRDTYIVRSFSSDRGYDTGMSRFGATDSANLPGGHKIHSLDRSAFERAIKEAMKDSSAR